MGPILLGSEDDLYGSRFNLLKKLPNSMFRASLKTYQDRDEYNFDFEQGDSVHRRAGSPSCADQRSSEPKVFRFERLAACCALARGPCLHHSKSAISAHGRFPEVPFKGFPFG
jgi:hypothetical protein